jgi:hypothetical protein
MGRSRRLAAGGAVAVLLLTGCGSNDPAIVGSAGTEAAAEITLVSDDSRATVQPVCMGDIPADISTCADAPVNVGQLELDETRKAALEVPAEVATGGYRVRVNGEPTERLEGVLEEQYVTVRIPEPVVGQPGETVLTVESLTSPQHLQAVWQFALSDPAGAPQ